MADRVLLSRRRILGAALASSVLPTNIALSRSRRKHRLFVDGLSFLPKSLSDIRASSLSAMICDVSEVEEVKDEQGFPRYLRTYAANEKALTSAVDRIKNSDSVYVARTGSELKENDKCAAFLQFQSCETLGGELGRIAAFKAKGLSILQLTHHNNNAAAGGAIEPAQSGLTAFGRDVIREMNRVKLIPDVSHGSGATIIETALLSKGPIVYSHGACRAIVDHPRCIDDAGIKAIADRGGMIGIFMMSFWLTRERVPTVDHWIAHVRHTAKVGGVESVGVANDFPMAGQESLVKLGNDNGEGVKEYFGWWRAMHARGVPGFSELPNHVVIPELNNIKRLDRIQSALRKAGFKAREVDRIMGGNWRRVLVGVLG